ncbi:MAG: SsrA-binding protein [Nitriliruptoraceae bacterium]|jgi:SsrA-binding protein
MANKTKKAKPGVGEGGTKLVAQNKRARFDYHLEDRFEAGIQLVGTEVKSLRNGKASLVEAWVKIDRAGQAWLMQANIAEYDHGNRNNHDPVRERKLLLHRREIDRLGKLIATQGVSLIPTRLYFKAGRAKLEFAVARGKNVADKREASKAKTAKREIDRALKSRGR